MDVVTLEDLATPGCTAPAAGAVAGIAARVAQVCPRPFDPLEVAAVAESLGYTDAVILDETGLPDSRALGAVLFDMLRAAPAPAAPPEKARRLRDLHVLLQTFSLSSVYALPWAATYAVERWRPELLRVPQAASGPLALAVMFSLIVSGGFVQCIARKGGFYGGLGQPALGAEVALRIWRAGAAALAITAAGGLALAWYFDVFMMRYAAIGAAFYVLFGLLWLTCGALWVERRYWHVPAVFAVAAGAFVLAQGAGAGALAAQGTAVAGATASAVALLAFIVRRHRRREGRAHAYPRFAVVARALAPYFCYGAGYFLFMFADRLAAGTAVPTVSGVVFSIDGRYQAGMDIALLCFLLSMTAVEFLNHRFVQCWHREGARFAASAGAAYRHCVRAHYLRSCAGVAAAFVAVAALVATIPAVGQTLRDPLSLRVAAFGLAGYLLFQLALFNALVLFSVNDPLPVLRALIVGVAVDAGAGYVLSNTFGPLCAAMAVAGGAGLLLWQTARPMRIALGRPGYGCYVA
jgi:hypothetical protein